MVWRSGATYPLGHSSTMSVSAASSPSSIATRMQRSASTSRTAGTSAMPFIRATMRVTPRMKRSFDSSRTWAW